ncbi:hypothetical protein HU200_011652 [Digitaria exilis]|uniref:Uncharacterized protein n=1 Tax=Digitaria exilis TaxID=1010633 RepID=A0A835FHR7_9POAL|nr:hypothetical protein HU200_011652 [Digitaria exilis]
MDGAAAAGGSGEPAANGSKHEGQQFDPSRMIGIIKRKALIKDLAAACHAECIASCKELLQLQRKWDEVLAPSSSQISPVEFPMFYHIAKCCNSEAFFCVFAAKILVNSLEGCGYFELKLGLTKPLHYCFTLF